MHITVTGLTAGDTIHLAIDGVGEDNFGAVINGDQVIDVAVELADGDYTITPSLVDAAVSGDAFNFSVDCISTELVFDDSEGMEISMLISNPADNMVVDWGDGTIDNFSSGDRTPTHTYLTGSEFTVKITGAKTLQTAGNGALIAINRLAEILEIIRIDNESLTALPKLPASLGTFSCHNNDIASIDFSGCPSIQYIDCGTNNLTTLDLSNCPQLSALAFNGNAITGFDASICPGLVSLDCSFNQLTVLVVTGCASLNNFNCANNQLTALDLSNLPALVVANLNTCQINALNTSNTPLLSDFNAAANALSTATVNSILAEFVSAALSGTTIRTDLQSPSAPPSGQGVIDKATLISAGWSVTTD